MEASIVLPVFLLFTFAIILLSTQLFAVYSTYYVCFQSLKAASVGPTKDGNGNVTVYTQQKLRTNVTENLKKLKINAKIPVTSVLIKVGSWCYNLNTFNPDTTSPGCAAAAPPLDIIKNSWVTLEVPVKIIDLNMPYVPIPTIRVRSTVKMYDWP